MHQHISSRMLEILEEGFIDIRRSLKHSMFEYGRKYERVSSNVEAGM